MNIKSLIKTNLPLISLFLLICCNLQAKNQSKPYPHILVIGIDGLGAHGIQLAKTPNMDELMKNGSYSLEARTIMPSFSGPAWASIFTGATMDRHGVNTNVWSVENKTLEPVYKGEHGMFPTIFGETRKNFPAAIIGAIYQWDDIGIKIEKGVCDVSIPTDTENDAAKFTCNLLREKRPLLTFVQLDDVDDRGHSDGFRSDRYMEAVTKVDSLVGVLINTLKVTGMYDETVVFVVSDHGGYEKSHGDSHPDEMIVPFIISGKGVKKGYKINHPVFNYDLAPTVAWLLGFQLNEWVSGKPLKDAFIRGH